MEPSESQEFQRNNVSRQNTEEDTENELEQMRSHYKEMLKLKEDRLEKLNERLRSLESENETMKSKLVDLKEENEKIRKTFIVTDKQRIEAEATIDNERRKFNEMKMSYEQWKDIDMSDYFVGETISEDLIRKRLQYDNVKMVVDKQYIQVLEETVNSLECQVRLQDALKTDLVNSSRGIFDSLFGKTKLKLEIERLTSENKILKDKEVNVAKLIKVHHLEREEQNKILKDKEENVAKLIKVHHLEREEQNKSLNDNHKEIEELNRNHQLETKRFEERINDLEESLKMQAQTNVVIKTVPDEGIIEELAKAKKTIQKKDVAIDGMKNRIDHLISKNETLEEERRVIGRGEVQSAQGNTDDNFKIRNLENQLRKMTLEYEQMELKYENAVETLRIKNIETDDLKSQHIHRVTIDQTLKYGNDVPQTFHGLSAPNRQVFNRDIELANCPCCDVSMPSDEIEAHLDECLQSQN